MNKEKIAATKRANAKKRYNRRRAAGLCVQCGKSADGRTYCASCREYHKQAASDRTRIAKGLEVESC